MGTKKQLLDVLELLKNTYENIDELKILATENAKKLDALLNTAGTKKPVSGKKEKKEKNENEKKCANISIFFSHFYPKDPSKFDGLFEPGEKKKILNSKKEEWANKKDEEKIRKQAAILYKNLTSKAKAKLQSMKKAELEKIRMQTKKDEERAEEEADSSDSS